MRDTDHKIQTGSKQAIVFGLISCTLLLAHTIGLSKSIYGQLDYIFSPFLVSGRNTAQKTKNLLTEISNKNRVVQDNLDLKREILKIKELEAINKDLKDQIAKLQLQTSIEKPKDKKLTLVNISGIQNIFSGSPAILIRAGLNQNVAKNDVVYYESNTLLGFVTEVYPNSSKVLPFYAPDLKSEFQVPVQNLKDSNQKSFISPIENGIVKMVKVPKEYQVNEGDVWITGNEVNEVPPNLIVGITKKVVLAPQEGFQEVELEIPFKTTDVNYVFIENKTK